MKTKIKKLVLCLAIPLAVGAASAFLTRDGMEAFKTLNKPPLSPPDWVFPVVWTILFILMGIASYLVWTSGARRRAIKSALTVYGVQLAFNFLWTIIYFNLSRLFIAFVWLLLLWALILVTTLRFYRLRKSAGYLMLPYLLWVAFAGYLNLAIYLLNR